MVNPRRRIISEEHDVFWNLSPVQKLTPEQARNVEWHLNAKSDKKGVKELQAKLLDYFRDNDPAFDSKTLDGEVARTLKNMDFYSLLIAMFKSQPREASSILDKTPCNSIKGRWISVNATNYKSQGLIKD